MSMASSPSISSRAALGLFTGPLLAGILLTGLCLLTLNGPALAADPNIEICNMDSVDILSTSTITADIEVSSEDAISIGDLDLSISSSAAPANLCGWITTLTSPDGTSVNIHDDADCPSISGDRTYDDEFCSLCGERAPVDELSAFDGEDMEGTWILDVEAPSYSGLPITMEEWCLIGTTVGEPSDVTCELVDDDTSVELTWTNIGETDSVVIARNGTDIASLDGTETSYVDPAVQGGVLVYVITAVSESGSCLDSTCVVELRITDTCDDVSTVEVEAVTGVVDDVSILLPLLLSFVPEISVTSPEGTSVTLTSGFLSNNALYSDHAVLVLGNLDLDPRLFTPLGPGLLEDFLADTDMAGTWTLSVPVAESWCVRIGTSPGETVCSDPDVEIPEDDLDGVADTLAVDGEFSIADADVMTDITHTFDGDLIIRLTSPDETEVTLMDEPGGGGNDVDLVWDDEGIDHGEESFTCRCPMSPSGPGALADFDSELSSGDWTLLVADGSAVFSGTATLNSWCLRLREACANPPSDVSCTGVSTTVTIEWVNNETYDGLVVERDGEVVAELEGDAESYDDSQLEVDLYTYQVIGILGACAAPSSPCEVEVTEPQFLRGDANGNGDVFAIIDAFFLLSYGFTDGPEPLCFDAADSDGNGTLLPILDSLYLLVFAFSDGPEPPLPGPTECGPDPEDNDLECLTEADVCR